MFENYDLLLNNDTLVSEKWRKKTYGKQLVIHQIKNLFKPTHDATQKIANNI